MLYRRFLFCFNTHLCDAYYAVSKEQATLFLK